jgi:NitT/TauT family transport system substrate-binding protein
MYFGIGPAMVARSRGIDIHVVAANVVEQVALIAQGEFAGQMKETPGTEGIRTFNEQAGRRVKIATLPKGSVPDTVLRYWLVKVLGVDLDEVEIVGMGASAVQQALLSGSVDAASILEPILTIVEKRLPSAIVIARGSEMLPNQPGAVVAVRGDILDRHPQAIARLVELHVRATELLKTDPKRAAGHVHAFIGKGLLSLTLLEQAIVSPSSNFEADPHVIIEATRTMQDFQREMGLLKEEVDLDALFNTRFYDALKREQ